MEEAVEQVAVGVHTGLRKGTEADSAMGLWNAISASQDGAWSDAVTFCLWSLEQMGYRLCKEGESPLEARQAEYANYQHELLFRLPEGLWPEHAVMVAVGHDGRIPLSVMPNGDVRVPKERR